MALQRQVLKDKIDKKLSRQLPGEGLPAPGSEEAAKTDNDIKKERTGMEKVKIGVIGAGNMGVTHIKNLKENKVTELELTAVSDSIPERRQWCRENLPETVRVFESGAELIESGCCQAVLIAVPHYQHPELAIKAFEQGLHVLCEKPAGVYAKQVREMNEAADKKDVVFAMMFNQRTNCVYRKMHEMVVNGELGEIRRVNWIVTDWYRTQSYYDSGSWRATWAGEGGGVLLNQCPHNLDLLQWICGMPSKVRSFCHIGKWHDIEVEDDVTAYLEYENGATGVFITSTGDAPGTNRFEITGDLGKLVCEEEKLTFYKLKESLSQHCAGCKGGFDKPEYEISEVETDGQNEQHIGVMKAFAGAILRGTPLVADGREGIRGLELSNAIHLSSWLDTSVEVPVSEELFLEELNKRRKHSRKKEGSSIVFDTQGSYGSKGGR